MKKYLAICLFSFSLLAACSNCEKPKENTSAVSVEEFNELKVKLNATEAQLLNVRTELVKCKGDSIPNLNTSKDSLNQ